MRTPFLLCVILAVAACAVPPRSATAGPATAVGPAAHARAGVTDPAKREIVLPGAAPGWRATLVKENSPTGIWTVKPMQAFPQYATPELVGCDDRGTLWIMVSYSGKWTPVPVLHDGSWLGGLDHAEVDARAPGAEIYVGSQLGSVYQVRTYPNGQADGRMIARIPGHEIHTIVAGEVDSAHAGPEVMIFTRPGGLWRLTPDAPDGEFTLTKVCDLQSRVRDAVVLPTAPGTSPPIAIAARDGGVRVLRLDAQGPQWEDVHRVAQGRGRLALAQGSQLGREVLYSTSDDGLVFRHQRGADGHWTTATIHRGAPGPRGIAAGRFVADPGVESVAVFGYGADCELLTRTAGGAWTAETLFTDRDSGHWLCAVEVDGRNDTEEIALCGYGARIVLLAREP